MEKIICIDIGIKNTGVAIFDNISKKLIDFYLISLENLDKFIKEMYEFDRLENIKMVIIEKQMAKNIKACALEAQLLLWFGLKKIKTKLFPAKNKYTTCEKSIYNTKYKRKKWAINVVKSFINQNNLIEKFQKIKKKMIFQMQF